MAVTTIKKDAFVFTDLNDVSSSEKLENIYVNIAGAYRPITDLKYVTKKDSVTNAIIDVKKVSSFSDFKKNINKLCIENGGIRRMLSALEMNIYINEIVVPKNYETISYDKTDATESEKIPYGLKRSLNVEQSNAGTGEFLYVQTNGDWKFLRKSEVFWYDGIHRKTYDDYLSEISNGRALTNVNFVDEYNKQISTIYTEYEYKFVSIKAKEEIDLKTHVKTTYEIKKDGSVETSKFKVDKFFSEQEFVTREIEDEKKPGKTKKISQIKVRNFQTVANLEQDDKEKYVALVVDGHRRMVQLKNIVDENGNAIIDIKTMLGKKVKIKDSEKIVGTSEPLTFEQANLLFDTIKTYQEVDGNATENSCLRLENGRYVEELKTVQPISYKLATSEDFDKYLIERTVGSEKQFVIIDKTYFEQHGEDASFDKTSAKKIKRCDFNDKDCYVVQTTSKGDDVEQCSIVSSKEEKTTAYQSFLESYQKGEYNIKDVYLNGTNYGLQNSKRYEYTDVSYNQDYADNLHDYKSLKTKNLSVEDGKLKGGVKFDVGAGIVNSYSVWGQLLVKGYGIVAAAGIFIPVVGPIVAAAYGVGMLVAIPSIPIVNAIIGAIKNTKKIKPFKDKTKYNRTKTATAVETKLVELYEKREALNQTQFDDAYSRIMAEILTLSATTSNNSLQIKDGKAEVNANNANAAREYKYEFNAIKKSMNAVSKEIAYAQKEFDKIDAVREKYSDGSVPSRIQNKWEKAKEKLEKLNSRKAEIEGKQIELMNSTMGESYGKDFRCDRLIASAEEMRLAVSVEKNPEIFVQGLTDSQKELLESVLYGNEFTSKPCLTINGLTINATDEEIASAFKDEEEAKDWKVVRDKLKNSTSLELDVKKPDAENVKIKAETEQTKSEEKTQEQDKSIDNQVENEQAKTPKTKREQKENKPERKEKAPRISYDAKIVSEDSLVEILKAKPESKKRKTLISEIEQRAGVAISEEDIQATIKRINNKHNPTKGERKSATAGSQTLKNKNIHNILVYGQQYLTDYAQDIKQRTQKPSEKRTQNSQTEF